MTIQSLLAFPAMFEAGYDAEIAAGGRSGTPVALSVPLLMYGAIDGVPVVQLRAGALLPRLRAGGFPHRARR
ncbi:MAG: hypothetical protein IT529_22360 [Burkholderiales bacterium]|nr:hypothetical protein [Burkholderiales bacterium]